MNYSITFYGTDGTVRAFLTIAVATETRAQFVADQMVGVLNAARKGDEPLCVRTTVSPFRKAA